MVCEPHQYTRLWQSMRTQNPIKEGLQNPCGKPAPANGMQRKADFANLP